MKNVTHSLQKKLTRHERMLHFAKQSQALKDHEGWKCIDDRLKAERQELLESFVREDLSEKARDLLQAKVQVIDMFLSVPKINADRISELERQVTHLRGQLESRKYQDIDGEIPGWKEHQASVRAIFGELVT